mgnify:CR=1 FL=1
MAPVSLGQQLGIMKVSLDGKPFADYPVLALEEVASAGFIGRLIDAVRLWFN